MRWKAVSYTHLDNIWIGAGNTIYRCNSTASIVKEYDIFGSQQNRHAINFVYQDREGNTVSYTHLQLDFFIQKKIITNSHPPVDNG